MRLLPIYPLPKGFMSSARKDRFHVVFIYDVPQHLSKENFEQKLEALVDAAVALPVFQNNLLKVEMIFQNDKLDDHVGTYGFGPRQEMVLLAMQSETAEHLWTVLSDPEVRSIFEKGKEFGLHNVSCGLAADIVPKIDKPSPPGCTHFVCVYKAPSRVSEQRQHDQTMDEFFSALLALPGVERNFVNFEMWRNNDVFDDHIRAFGYSAAATAFVLRADTEHMDNALEILMDPEGQKMMETAESKGLALKTDGYLFHVDVATKLEKA